MCECNQLVLRRAFYLELEPEILFLADDCGPSTLWPVVNQTNLVLIAYPVNFVYHLYSQHPQRYISDGVKDEVKPDAEGLGQLRPALDVILSR